MPVTVAFWNVNIGAGSSNTKKQVLTDWCTVMQPGLLLLEEVGAFTDNAIQDLTKMEQLNHVHTLNVNLKPGSKRIYALQRPNGPFQARVLRFPDLVADKALLKVTMNRSRRPVPTWARLSSEQGFAMWVVHADDGGGAAPEKVASFLNRAVGQTQVVGGDFNLNFANAPATALKSRGCSWQGTPLQFTQWRRGKEPIGPASSGLASLHLIPALLHTPVEKGVKPNPNILDYVMFGSGRTIRPVPNSHPVLWPRILDNFDHCPVVYEIS